MKIFQTEVANDFINLWRFVMKIFSIGLKQLKHQFGHGRVLHEAHMHVPDP